MYRLFKGRTAAKAATGALVGLALCSCASHYVAPNAKEKDRANFAAATTYASKQAGELHEKLVKLDKYDRRTGAVILGSGVAAIALGAYGAHADALLGASFIGTATYGAREYVPIQARKRIYANGASAIRCAIAALRFKDLEPAIVATQSSLDTLTPLSPLTYPGLDLGIQAAETRRDEAETRAKEFITAANEVVKDEKKADMLIAATDAILDSVTEQLIETQLDPDGARNALTSSAETHASALREAYEALEAAVSEAQEQSEEAKQAARVLLLASNFSAEVMGNGGDGAVTDVKDAGVAAEKNTSNLKAVVSSATRVLEILNLQSTCAAQPST